MRLFPRENQSARDVAIEEITERVAQGDYGPNWTYLGDETRSDEQAQLIKMINEYDELNKAEVAND